MRNIKYDCIKAAEQKEGFMKDNAYILQSID